MAHGADSDELPHRILAVEDSGNRRLKHNLRLGTDAGGLRLGNGPMVAEHALDAMGLNTVEIREEDDVGDGVGVGRGETVRLEDGADQVAHGGVGKCLVHGDSPHGTRSALSS